MLERDRPHRVRQRRRDSPGRLHLPGFVPGGGYDIPLVFADRLFDPTTGLLAFDTFNTDGIIGNVFLVNGKASPFLEVNQRRYRFRLLVAGPSRFYEFFLTNPDNLSQSIPFLVITEDGNYLGRPVKTTSVRLGVAERNDVLVDFARIAREFGTPKRLILENRLEQTNGRGADRQDPAGDRVRAVDHREQVGRLAAPRAPPLRGVPHPQPQRRQGEGRRHRVLSQGRHAAAVQRHHRAPHPVP
jgi:hypothetical protein